MRANAPFLDDGHHDSVTSLVTPTMRRLLFDDRLRWLSAAEPSPFAGGVDRPAAYALRADATAIADFAYIDKDTGELFAADVAVDLSSPPAEPGPPARRDYAAVYSRAQERVFVVGGKTAGGALLDDVWTHAPFTPWKRVPLPAGVLGQVISATFSYRDGRLWVLDVDPRDPHHAQTRLLRIEVETGGYEVVLRPTSDRPSPKYDLRGLGIDMDGSILVYASSTLAQKHRIAILTPRVGGYDVKMTKRRARPLSMAPIVDLRGVALYFDEPRTPKDTTHDADDEPAPPHASVIAERLRALPLRDATLQQIEELLR